MPLKTIPGYCPMDCGATLAVANNRIICWSEDCPRPTAVEEILGEGEGEHIVQLDFTTFTIQHPLRERLDGGLFACDLHAKIADLTGPPESPGRYRVNDEFQWEPWS